VAAVAGRHSGDGGMADRNLPMGGDNTDDLPRTLRRERDAREREAREREMRAQSTLGTPEPASYAPRATPVYPDDPQPAVVKRFDVPFLHLTLFFLKAVVAAVPALLLLLVLLYGLGRILETQAPWMLFYKITIENVRPSEASAVRPLAPAPVPAPTKK